MRSTTRRAFLGVTRMNRAWALASIADPSLPRASCSACSAATAAAVFLDMATERPRRRELAELVPHHGVGDEYRDVLAAVVHGDRVTDHVRHDHGAPRPRLDDVLGALLVLDVHLLDQVVVHEGALLKATWHDERLLPFLLAATTDNQPVA